MLESNLHPGNTASSQLCAQGFPWRSHTGAKPIKARLGLGRSAWNPVFGRSTRATWSPATQSKAKEPSDSSSCCTPTRHPSGLAPRNCDSRAGLCPDQAERLADPVAAVRARLYENFGGLPRKESPYGGERRSRLRSTGLLGDDQWRQH